MSKNSLLTLLLLPWIAAGCTAPAHDAVGIYLAPGGATRRSPPGA